MYQFRPLIRPGARLALGLATCVVCQACSSTPSAPQAIGAGGTTSGQAGSAGSGGGQVAGSASGGAIGAGNAGRGGAPAGASGTGPAGSAGASNGGVGSAGAASVGGGGAGGGSSRAPANVPFPNVDSSLVLRLEYDSGVQLTDSHVSAWMDQSAKHNDARQDGAAFRPALADVGGLKLVSFSGKVDPNNYGGDGGTYLGINDSDSLHFGTNDFAVLVVAGYDNLTDGTHSGAFGTFFGKEGTQQSPAEILFTGNWTYDEKTEHSNIHFGFGEGGPPGYETDKVGFNDRKLRLYVGQRIGDRMAVRINGTDQGGLNGAGNTDVSSPGSDVGIGSFSGSSATRCLKGDVAAVLAVSGDQTSGAVMALEGYLMAKYPIAPLP